jgi:hypothetical protein
MSKALAVPAFDYSEVDKETKGKLLSLARDINRGLTKFKDAGEEIGKAVCEAHRLLADQRKGLFEHWVEAETGIGLSTAYNLKNIEERRADFPIIGKLPPTVGYLLAAPNVPPEAIREVEKAINKGQRATVEFAKATLDKFRAIIDRGKAADSGKDDRTDSAGTKPQETSHRPPRSGRDKPVASQDYGKCPNCAGIKWTEDEFGVTCAKCHQPHGEPSGGPDEQRVKDQLSKAVKTCEALMRAFDDLNRMVPRQEHVEAIASCKFLLKTARAWK